MSQASRKRRSMDRKQVKQERTKRYFLDAAKEIISEEGIGALTTKRIGDRASYSYASIYNYFENFNELCCLCLEEMAAECASWVAERLEGELAYDRILLFSRLMIEANAKRPKAYSIFLSTDIDYGYFQRRDGHHFMHPAYAMLRKEIEALPGLASGGEEARVLSDILTYVFHSKMHFYIRYGAPPSLELLYAEVEEETRFLLDRTEKRVD
jgi:AcrR family transcriptional regulator